MAEPLARSKRRYPLNEDGTEDRSQSGRVPATASDKYNAGRWPANVTLSHLPECERVGTRRVKGECGDA